MDFKYELTVVPVSDVDAMIERGEIVATVAAWHLVSRR